MFFKITTFEVTTMKACPNFVELLLCMHLQAQL